MNILKKTYKAAAMAVVAAGGLLITSCSEDLPTYKDSESRLNFNFGSVKINTEKDVPKDAYSFVYSGGLEIDTIWVGVDLMGFPADHDRKISVKQIATGTDDAVAGTHFVDFNDPTLTPFYTLKAGEVSTKVPVVVLRDESLSTKAYNLDVALVANNDFQSGYPLYQVKHLQLSDMLAKPTLWDTYNDGAIAYYFTSWGPVAHQFMIDVTGFPFDDNFIKQILDSPDINFVYYLAEMVARAKIKYNQDHPDKPLQEKDGTLISFGWEMYL